MSMDRSEGFQLALPFGLNNESLPNFWHLAGLASAEEERFIKEWLSKNPQHAVTYQVIRSRFLQVTANVNLASL